MKPVVTWIVLANARRAFVVTNRGPGKGLVADEGNRWHADPAAAYSDRAGVGHSIAGPGVSAVDQGAPQHQADLKFARDVARHLDQALAAREFDRILIVAGPYMLGLMRQALTRQLQAVLVAEIAKDLSAMPLEGLEAHLGEVIAL